MLPIGMCCTAFFVLRYIASIPSFIRAIIMKRCWVLWKAFYAFIEIIMWFLSLLLLICCIKFNYLSMLSHLCIPGMKPIWLVYNTFDILLNLVCQIKWIFHWGFFSSVY
jgi:hypothetical protein